jgi:hypothetical protein
MILIRKSCLRLSSFCVARVSKSCRAPDGSSEITLAQTEMVFLDEIRNAFWLPVRP